VASLNKQPKLPFAEQQLAQRCGFQCAEVGGTIIGFNRRMWLNDNTDMKSRE
jgi:hypothetical protein